MALRPKLECKPIKEGDHIGELPALVNNESLNSSFIRGLYIILADTRRCIPSAPYPPSTLTTCPPVFPVNHNRQWDSQTVTIPRVGGG